MNKPLNGSKTMEMKQEHKPCEEKTTDTLYRIGMFANMNHITVKTLRFYEEHGLLMPALIHPENGYRYYTLSQMEVLHRITALKSAGFSLEEIARINSGVDEQAVLLKKKSELIAKVSELTRQISVVDGYLSKGKTGLSSPVLIKTVPETTVAYMRIRLESYDCLFDRMPEMGALMEQSGCICALPEYCFTGYPEPGYKDGDILVDICEAVAAAKTEVGDLKFKTLPQIQAACVFHKGSYRTFSQSYETVLRYIEENGYSKSGGERWIKALENAAELTAKLLKDYGWGIDKVTKHQDYSGKHCPHRILDEYGWGNFLSLVKKNLTTPAISKPTPTPSKPDVIYQVWDDVKNKWLPNVKNDKDYAGIFGHAICAVFANLSKGNIFYKVHYKGGKWLPEVKNRTDYAGLFNRPIDGLMMKTDTGAKLYYRVHLRRSGKWLPWVTGYNANDNNNGYAGIIGQEIDGIQIKF